MALLALSSVSFGALGTSAQAATGSFYSFTQYVSFSNWTNGGSSVSCSLGTNCNPSSGGSFTFFQSISFYYFNSTPAGTYTGGFLQQLYQSLNWSNSPTGSSFDYKSFFQQTAWNYYLPAPSGSGNGSSGGSSSSNPLVSWMSGNLGGAFSPAGLIGGQIS